MQISHTKPHYEVLRPKEFKSSIPPHLIADLPDDERFMVETMSKLENQYEWLRDGLIHTNEAILDLDERVNNLENCQQNTHEKINKMDKLEDRVTKLWDWKQMFMGKWGVLTALILIMIPILLKFILDVLLKWLK